MGDVKSILPEAPKKETYPSGLRKYVQVKTETINIPLTYPRLDILFGNPNKYSDEEKKKWWEEHKDKDKQFKIGLIKTKELDTRITIFGEVFDFSKTAKKNEPTSNKEDANVKKAGFNTSDNVIEEEIDYVPETYYTSKDFDKLYLGWLEPEEKARRISLKQLFRFIFGTRKIKDVNKFHTKLLAAYTKFNPEEKVPCETQTNTSSLRSDFEDSLQYRRKLVLKEIEAANQAIGENTLYMEQKKAILQGLRDMLNRMYDREEKTKCFVYGNDDTMKEDVDVKEVKLTSRIDTFSNDDMTRLVRIFQNYINTMEKFKGKNVSTQGKELYEELLKLLQLSNKAGSSVDKQKELEEMTQLVEHLSFLLNAYSELHAIHIELKNIELQFEKKKYEDILEKNKTLQTRIEEFVVTTEKGDTEVSQLLYRFAQSLLKNSQENSEQTRQEIITRFENKERELIGSRQRVQELEQQLAQCNEQLRQSQQRSQEATQQLQQIQYAIQTVIGPELVRKQTEIESVQHELDELRLEQSELQAQKTSLEQQIQEQERFFEGKESDYQEQLLEKDEELEDKDERIAELEREAEECRERLTTLEAERNALQQRVQEQTAMLEGFVGELGEVRIQDQQYVEEATRRLQQKDAQIAETREELERVVTELGRVRQGYEQEHTSHDELERQRDQLQQLLEKRTKQIRELEKGKQIREPNIQQAKPKMFEGGGASLSKEATCETMLTLLLFHIKEANMNVQDFLDKAGASLDDLGQCPIVLHVLNEMLDEANDMDEKEDSIVYSPIRSERSNEIMDSIEKSIQGRFSEEEQDVLANLNKPITFYSKPPEAYSDSMGNNAYMLNNNVKGDSDETALHGLIYDDEIHLTKEERDEIEKGGISLGAITFLYLTCLRDIQSRNETPTSSSKCLLPKRTLERAKTPKQSHKRTKGSTLRSKQSTQPTPH